MRVYDVPKGCRGFDRAMRVAVHGSCRVHGPFEALATAGTIRRVWANYRSISFTLGEAHQAVRHSLGGSDISRPLLPFIFDDADRMPPGTSAQRRVLDDVDAFLIEVSDLRQVRYRDIYFQLQNFTRHFISKHGLSQWYRLFSVSSPISDEIVQKSLSGITGLTAEERDLFESVLRETHLERVEVEQAKQFMEKINFNPAAHWTFVSHFVVPGLSGSLMQDRRTLSETLREATEACGAGFFDPSDTVARHGKEVALAKGGSDIHHYDEAFEFVIAETLLDQIHASLPRTAAAAKSAHQGKGQVNNVALQAVASALNALLVSLHRQRLAQSSIDDSGLYAHYFALLERKQIVARHNIDIVDIILHYLPEFDGYHVLNAGLGEIAFLLSAFGRKAAAVDRYARRFSAIEAGTSYLQGCGFLREDSCQTMQGVVPGTAGQGRVLAVATQMAMTVPPSEEEDILQRLEEYDAILFFPTLLVRSRNEAGEQERLLDRFRGAGFTLIRDFPNLNVVYCAKDEAVGSSMASAQPRRALAAA